jgi:hypothetical protein
MAFTYCRHCGFKNLYSMAEPKFCGSCGLELSGKGSGLVKASGEQKPPTRFDFEKRKKLARDGTEDAELNKDGTGENTDSHSYETDVDYVPKLKALKHSVVNADSLGGNVMKLDSFLPKAEAPEEKAPGSGEIISSEKELLYQKEKGAAINREPIEQGIPDRPGPVDIKVDPTNKVNVSE